MASFTDSPVKFNPYVQQLPVEAMAKIGMQKQQAYEEGVQKIQTQIDNVAGLSIGRDVDKAYLQSKLNQLGNNLRTVAAGDFSNFQLVNSVGGMTKQISNDPYIQAAVTSTAIDAKERAAMDEDRRKGTLTPQAELFYNLKRKKYYDNTSLKNEDGSPIGFTGKYIESWDLDKNMLEAVKGVGDKTFTSDNVFQKIDGQIAKDANGKPIYSEYAIRAKRQGKFSENVEAAINGVLERPEAKQELTMRGVYNYQGYNNIDDFVKSYEKQKNKVISSYESNKLSMMEKVANAATPEEKATYTAAVNYADSLIEKTKQDYDLKENQAKQFGSVEAYKAALETMKVKNNYMISGVTESTSQEIIENIPYNKQQDKLKMEQAWWATQDASKRGWAGVEISKANLKVSQGNLALNEAKWAGDPDNPANKNATTPHELALGNSYITHYGALMDASNAASSTLESTKFETVSAYMSAINYGNGKSLTKEEIDASIKAYEKKSPGFIDKKYAQAKSIGVHSQLAANPLYAGLMSILPNAYAAENDLAKVSNTVESMNNSAGVQAAGAKEVDLKTIEKNYKPFEIEYTPLSNWDAFSFNPNKVKKTVSAQDAMDIAIVARNEGGIKGMWKTLTATEVEKDTYEKAKARLESKFDLPTKELLAAVRPGSTFKSLAGIPINSGMNSSLGKVFETVASQKFDNVMKAKEEYLANHSLVPQPIAYNVYDVNMKGPERTSTDDRVKDVLNKYKNTGGLEAFNKLYSDSKNFSSQVAVDRGTTINPKETYTLNLYDAGSLIKSIPIAKTDLDYIKQTTVKLPPMPSEVNQSISVHEGTTNTGKLPPADPRAHESSYFPATYFGDKFNTTTKGQGADVVKNPSGGYSVYIYTNDPRSNNTIGVPFKVNKTDRNPYAFPTADAAASFIATEIDNPATLNNIINNGL